PPGRLRGRRERGRRADGRPPSRDRRRRPRRAVRLPAARQPGRPGHGDRAFLHGRGRGRGMTMEFTPKKRLELYAGRSNPALAAEVAADLGVPLGEPNLRDFPSGEIHCRFDESVRGTDVFILQTHAPPVNDSIVEQLIMIDAAKRASAKRITAVCPYYGYSRQDRKAEGREPITAKLLADMLNIAGPDLVASFVLHSGPVRG